MYIRRTRLSPHKQGTLLKLFVAGATARAAAEILGVHRNTAAGFYLRLRKLIAGKMPSYRLAGEVEADESYFGGSRKGRRGRGTAGKVVVFGLLKRSGKVYTAIVPTAHTDSPLIFNLMGDRCDDYGLSSTSCVCGSVPGHSYPLKLVYRK